MWGGEGEEEEKEEEEGEGEGRRCLWQEHDSRAVREREGSEWPLDHGSNCSGAVEPAHRKTYKHLSRNVFPLLMLCCCLICRVWITGRD